LIWERRKQCKLGRLTSTKKKMAKWKARTCFFFYPKRGRAAITWRDAVQCQWMMQCRRRTIASTIERPQFERRSRSFSSFSAASFLVLRRVSDLPINTCLLSSRPKPTPSSCPWGAESTPKDAGRTPRFLRFQVKSREPTASAVFSRGSCLRISFFLSADFFLSWPLLGCRVPITVRC
jgi:hypothetical protein